MPTAVENEIAIKYFGDVRFAYERAEYSAGGRVARQYQVGGHCIRLCFAGPALAPLISPAFEHLAVSPDSETDLRVLLWDSETTGVDIPQPPWDVEDPVRRGALWLFQNSRFRILYNPRNATLSLMDFDQDLAIYRVPAAQRMPQYESGSPLLQILEWWFDRRQQYVLHAGAVGKAGGGVLLVGKGGSGKSTAALACLDSDLLYVSDDYCMLTNADHPRVCSLYNSAKVRRTEIDRFPYLKTAFLSRTYPDSDKALCFVHEHLPSKLLPGFPVRAVLIPKVTGLPESILRAASPAQALLSLAPSTVFHFPGTGNGAIRSMGKLVRQVPCYLLDLGTNLATIADAVSRVLG